MNCAETKEIKVTPLISFFVFVKNFLSTIYSPFFRHSVGINGMNFDGATRPDENRNDKLKEALILTERSLEINETQNSSKFMNVISKKNSLIF
jgi:hypothetical protein